MKGAGKKGAGVKAVLALAVALGVLVACGKKGPPDPPGPPDKIRYPKTYPTH
jgi:hypothetical protein